MEVKESIERSKDAILHKLDAGPHDFIGEPHIKEVWKTNAWKLSIKGRQFVDAICGYYDDDFRRQAAAHGGLTPPDQWTLSILSKVIYHPAIGDAIDEDGSGFISVHEVNHFLKKIPEGWTVPQWFAFWAIGWQYTNMTYTANSAQLLQLIQDASDLTIKRTKDENLKAIITEYLVTIDLLRILVSWLDVAGDETGTADVSYQAAAEVEAISDKLVEERDPKLVERLQQLEFEITDESQLTTIIGAAGFRIEQWMTCLLYHLLQHQYDVINSANSKKKNQPATREPLTDQEWLNMDRSLSTLVFTFHYRMKALLRGWRSQKIEINLQIETFAGGVYEGWYRDYIATESKIRKILENEPEEDPIIDEDEEDEEDEAEANQPAAAPEPTPMDALTGRVSAMESRLGNIEKMLQQLLSQNQNSGSNQSNKGPSKVGAAASRALTNGMGSNQQQHAGGDGEEEEEEQQEPEDDQQEEPADEEPPEDAEEEGDPEEE